MKKITFILLILISIQVFAFIDFKFQASDGQPYEHFGSSFSILGNRILIGAWRADTENGVESGAAYLYEYDGENWIEIHKFVGSDRGRWFGKSVLLYEDQVIIGEPMGFGSGNSSGVVHIYEFDGNSWSLIQKLRTEVTMFGRLGWEIKSLGNKMMIGAVSNEPGGTVFVYENDGTSWNEIDEIKAQPLPFSGNFGSSIHMDGNLVAIGEIHHDNAMGNTSGAAYVFEYDGKSWVEKAMFINDEGEIFDEFGTSVSINGNWAVVGAPRENNLSPRDGAAYIYKYEEKSWNFHQKIILDITDASSRLGSSVLLKNNLLFIGAKSSGASEADPGAIFIYQNIDGYWRQTKKHTPELIADGATIGSNIEVIGDFIIAGASRDDGETNDTGAVYMFNYELIFSNDFETSLKNKTN